MLEDLNPNKDQSFIDLILKRLQDEAKTVYLAGIKECAILGLSNAMYQLGIRLIEGQIKYPQPRYRKCSTYIYPAIIKISPKFPLISNKNTKRIKMELIVNLCVNYVMQM